MTSFPLQHDEPALAAYLCTTAIWFKETHWPTHEADLSTAFQLWGELSKLALDPVDQGIALLDSLTQLWQADDPEGAMHRALLSRLLIKLSGLDI